jgi:hypothetical protein
VEGGGKDDAPGFAADLAELRYRVLLLLDSDKPPNEDALIRAVARGVTYVAWPGNCSTETRVFLDLPWPGVQELIALAEECFGTESVLGRINRLLAPTNTEIGDLALANALDNSIFRRALGGAASGGKWFKDIARAERLAAVAGPYLAAISATPLAVTIARLRVWIDAPRS